MKSYERIINLTITLIVLLVSILTIIDVNEVEYQTNLNIENINEHVEEITKGPRSIIDDEMHENTFQYIVNELESNGIIKADTVTVPAYMIQEDKVDIINSYNDLYSMVYGTKYQDTIIYNESYPIKNIIVSIPGKSTTQTENNDAIMIMAHYDSVPMGSGASDDGVAVCVMLEAINYYLDQIQAGLVIENDLVFVFSDAEEFGMDGARVFAKGNDGQSGFQGFNHLLDRIKFAVNLESRGTSGTLIMFETSNNNYNTIQLFSKMNKNIFTSSIANLVYQNMPNGTDFSNYKDMYQGLNFANLGGGYNYHTQNDSFENVGYSYLTQTAMFIENLVDELGNYQLDHLYEATSDAIFFSYLNFATIYYSYTFAYILAIISLILMGFIIFLQIRSKIENKTNLMKTLKGYLVIIIAIVANVIVTYALYYLFNFTASIFGVIDSKAIGKVGYSNTYLVLGVIFLSIGVTTLVNYFLTKLLKIEARDVRKAITYFIASIGILLSFVLPVTSYLFIIPGLLLLVLELLEKVIKKVKIENLHLQLLVFAIAIPIFVPVIFLASDALGSDMAYALAAIVAIYSLIFIPEFTSFFKYITIAYLRKLYHQVFHKDSQVDLKPIYGILNFILIALISLLLVTSFQTTLSTNIQGKQSIPMLPYDDALVYVIDNNEAKFLVKDLDAYTVIKKDLDGYHYDENLGGYVKQDENPNVSFENLSEITLNTNTLQIDRKANNGFVEISFENNQNILSLEVLYGDKSEVYNISDKKFNLRIRHDATIEFITKSNAEVNATIKVIELIFNYEPLNSYQDFEKVVLNENAKYNLIYVNTLDK